ncbi:MAG TPA: hypothetical protein VHN14_04350 [Kofleriaceae bacterium]|jgi:hypothetical protein|nr:hypothetical protein [Kofleriaceae bacterium]
MKTLLVIFLVCCVAGYIATAIPFRGLHHRLFGRTPAPLAAPASRWRIWRWIAAAAVPALLLVTPARTASAGESCLGGCSETHNKSQYGVFTARDWCSGGPCSGSQTLWIYTGQQTPDNQDWDTFRVDAGWCYKGSIRTYIYPFWHTTNYTWDQSGKGNLWIQVHNNQTATVDWQGYGHC